MSEPPETGPSPQRPALRADLSAAGEVCLFSHLAMGSPFRLAIAGRPAKYAEQAAEAAFDSLEQIEHALSHTQAASDISQINASPGQAVPVGPFAWECLLIARHMYELTGGAFDVTAAALLEAYRQGQPRPPRATMADVEFDSAAHAIRLPRPGMRIDLGGIGKGYALDHMTAVLGDWGINRALLDAGQSTAVALGSAGQFGGWPINLRDPRDEQTVLGSLMLENRAISGSGVSQQGVHIFDTRTGEPAGRLAAWSMAPTASQADALSTAFMVMSAEQIEAFCQANAGTAGMIFEADGQLHRFGVW